MCRFNLNKITRASSSKMENNRSDRCFRKHPVFYSYPNKGTRDARKILSEIRAIKSKANSYTPDDEVLRNVKMTSLR